MICCVTGHRPEGFPFPYESASMEKERYRIELKKNIMQLIAEGTTHFISGMAQGVDLDFAEEVLRCKTILTPPDKEIRLEAALPFPRQKQFSDGQPLDRYREILLACDIKTVVSPCYQKNSFQKRNQYMVDKADIVLAVWNGIKKGGTWNTIHYAQKCGRPLRLIMLNDLHE